MSSVLSHSVYSDPEQTKGLRPPKPTHVVLELNHRLWLQIYYESKQTFEIAQLVFLPDCLDVMKKARSFYNLPFYGGPCNYRGVCDFDFKRLF